MLSKRSRNDHVVILQQAGQLHGALEGLSANHRLSTPDNECQAREVCHHIARSKNGIAGSKWFVLRDERYIFTVQCLPHCGFCIWRNNNQWRSRWADALTNAVEDVNDRRLMIDKREWFRDSEATRRRSRPFSRGNNYRPDFACTLFRQQIKQRASVCGI